VDLEDGSIGGLSETLSLNKALKSINLSRNDGLTGECVGTLLGALESNKTLELMDVQDCELGHDGVELLKEYQGQCEVKCRGNVTCEEKVFMIALNNAF